MMNTMQSDTQTRQTDGAPERRIRRRKQTGLRIGILLTLLALLAYAVPEGLLALQSSGPRVAIAQGADFPTDI